MGGPSQPRCCFSVPPLPWQCCAPKGSVSSNTLAPHCAGTDHRICCPRPSLSATSTTRRPHTDTHRHTRIHTCAHMWTHIYTHTHTHSKHLLGLSSSSLACSPFPPAPPPCPAGRAYRGSPPLSLHPWAGELLSPCPLCPGVGVLSPQSLWVRLLRSDPSPETYWMRIKFYLFYACLELCCLPPP